MDLSKTTLIYAAILAVFLLFLIIISVVILKKSDDDEDDEYYLDDEFEEFEEEEVSKKKKKKDKKAEKKAKKKEKKAKKKKDFDYDDFDEEYYDEELPAEDAPVEFAEDDFVNNAYSEDESYSDAFIEEDSMPVINDESEVAFSDEAFADDSAFGTSDFEEGADDTAFGDSDFEESNNDSAFSDTAISKQDFVQNMEKKKVDDMSDSAFGDSAFDSAFTSDTAFVDNSATTAATIGAKTVEVKDENGFELSSEEISVASDSEIAKDIADKIAAGSTAPIPTKKIEEKLAEAKAAVEAKEEAAEAKAVVEEEEEAAEEPVVEQPIADQPAEENKEIEFKVEESIFDEPVKKAEESIFDEPVFNEPEFTKPAFDNTTDISDSVFDDIDKKNEAPVEKPRYTVDTVISPDANITVNPVNAVNINTVNSSGQIKVTNEEAGITDMDELEGFLSEAPGSNTKKKKKVKKSEVEFVEKFGNFELKFNGGDSFWYNSQDIAECRRKEDMYYYCHYFDDPDECIIPLIVEMYDCAFVKTEEIQLIAYGVEYQTVGFKEIIEADINTGFDKANAVKEPTKEDRELIYKKWVGYVDKFFETIVLVCADESVEYIKEQMYEYGHNEVDTLLYSPE